MAINTALVVDDSRVGRISLTKMLERRAIQVVQQESGESAIDYLKQHRPDVVFLDYMMPAMDGIETARQISRNPATADIPLYLYTGEEGGSAKQAALDSGIRGFLTKPTPDELLDRVLAEAAQAAPRTPAAPAAPAGLTEAQVQALVDRRLTELRGEVDSQVRQTVEAALAALRGELQQDLPARAEAAARQAAEAATQSALSNLSAQWQGNAPDPEAMRHTAAQAGSEAAEGVAREVARQTAEQTAAGIARQAGEAAAREVMEAGQSRLRELAQDAARQTGGGGEAAQEAAREAARQELARAGEELNAGLKDTVERRWETWFEDPQQQSRLRERVGEAAEARVRQELEHLVQSRLAPLAAEAARAEVAQAVRGLNADQGGAAREATQDAGQAMSAARKALVVGVLGLLAGAAALVVALMM